ncbi:hypothetical protein GCK72_018818 [Caenorhabditis remanei]|uniref:C6 domain-containing protein n=1 Tax=Caenorhabditis remanei TaxID=31234 RepID=A0A6A5GC04_CAERE|nr:hypothetical protein GCK72_018818 [Caenorhabditis remanei]KAF1752264.1 hypothetical protein GCK72_018818 [Caenorhabditis remanei]
MNFILNILLLSGFIALCQAACNVCNCNAPPTIFDEAQFNAVVKNSGNPEIRTFIEATSHKITDCVVTLDCDFGDSYEENRIVYLTADGGESYSLNLNDMVCVDGSKWTADGKEVTAIGCYGKQSPDFGEY